MDNFIQITIYLLIGLLLRRLPGFPPQSVQTINTIIIYISLPALIMINIPKLPLGKEMFSSVAMPWLMILSASAVSFAISRTMKWPRTVEAVLMLMVPLGNTAFMGIPMVEAFFGSERLPYAIIYDQLGSFLALSTYGAVIVAIYSSRNFSPKPGAILMKILKFPPFIALAVAFLLRSFEYPQSIEKTFVKLAGTLIPLVMVSIGMQLKLRIAPTRLYPLLGGLMLKLIVSPVIALIFCKILGLYGA